jgi:hypothetical protein
VPSLKIKPQKNANILKSHHYLNDISDSSIGKPTRKCIRRIYRKERKVPEAGLTIKHNIPESIDYFQNIQFVYISSLGNILFIPKKYWTQTTDHGIDLSGQNQ